jgi:hypothetical protein
MIDILDFSRTAATTITPVNDYDAAPSMIPAFNFVRTGAAPTNFTQHENSTQLLKMLQDFDNFWPFWHTNT